MNPKELSRPLDGRLPARVYDSAKDAPPPDPPDGPVPVSPAPETIDSLRQRLAERMAKGDVA